MADCADACKTHETRQKCEAAAAVLSVVMHARDDSTAGGLIEASA